MSTDVDCVCMADWMAWLIKDSRPFFGVILPGSHNSATCGIKTVVAGNWARCQELTVTQQLDMGVRLLDLRVADNITGSAVRPHHGGAGTPEDSGTPSDCGRRLRCDSSRVTCSDAELNLGRTVSFGGQSPGYLATESELGIYAKTKLWVTHRFKSCPLSPVLLDISEFLKRHPGEVIAIRLERDWDRSLSAFGLRALKWLLQSVFGDRHFAKVSTSTLMGDLRGQNKRIVLCTKDSFYDELEEKYRCNMVKSRIDRISPSVPVLDSAPCVASCSTPSPSRKRSMSVPRSRGPLSKQETADYECIVTEMPTPRCTRPRCDCEVSAWFRDKFTVAVPSWLWTRGCKGDAVLAKTKELLNSSIIEKFTREGHIFILEAFLTHEAGSIAKNPFSSIKAANVVMVNKWLPLILNLFANDPRGVHGVAVDFVTPMFCKRMALMNDNRRWAA